MTEFQTQVYDNILTGHVRRKEKMKLKAALAVAEEDLVNGSTKAKKKGKGNGNVLVNNDPSLEVGSSTSVVGSVAATVIPGDCQKEKGEKGESDSEKVVRELSNSEAAHLFTALRKAANHPLLLRVRYQDEEVMSKIAGTAYSRGRFGNQCDYQRVRDEIDNFSDFDLHQLCLEYPETLGHLQLDAEVLYDSQKMQKLKTMLPKLVVRRKKATFHISHCCILRSPTLFFPLLSHEYIRLHYSILSLSHFPLLLSSLLCNSSSSTYLSLLLLITFRSPFSSSLVSPFPSQGGWSSHPSVQSVDPSAGSP